MRYTTLLFDLDNTLMDFSANEADSLNKLFSNHGYALSDELLSAYHTVNRQLWSDYENGSILLDDVVYSRFSKTMSGIGQTVDGIAWENMYRELLGNGYQLMEGALELCARLSATHRMFIVTNGLTQTQIRRMQQSGLYEYFEEIFTSQNIGYQKPSKEFFEHVMTHIKDFDKTKALVIGDSFATDIKGGIQAGIDTCWINLHAQKNPQDIHSTYTVATLAEVYDICVL